MSLAQLFVGELAPERAAMAILIAAWTNTALKCVLVMALGSRALGRRIVAAALPIIGAGAVAALVV